MAKLIAARQVEQVIRNYLQINGCALSSTKKPGETGADITARKGKHTWFVEVIGFESNPPTRSRDFYEAFFRVISRDRHNRNDTLVIGLPKRFKNGMRQRKRQYPVAWEELGGIFPNLKLWYVDTQQSTLEEYPWSKPFDK